MELEGSFFSVLLLLRVGVGWGVEMEAILKLENTFLRSSSFDAKAVLLLIFSIIYSRFRLLYNSFV
jgi:hypothetical protein